MPVLAYLADTNAISDLLRGATPVREWFLAHADEIGISTLTLAEMRRGIELRPEGKVRRELDKRYRFLLADYRGAVFVFDEAAAMEWGKLMAETRHNPIPYEDSLIGAIARSAGLKVVTRNLKHFRGCATVDPWTGQEHAPWAPKASHVKATG